MSTTIDQRVVEMRFDNRQFESNVQTSMSTLEKLKRGLNLTGASKGLDDINRSAKNNNIGMLGSAAETVGLKFSAMYTYADQTMRRITDSVNRTAKQMVSSFTIEPIKTGLAEYETQINSVQTILANTESKGSTLGDVNAALDELNTYADKTIYNFTEMTRNIGTFTAAGVDLDKSVTSIKGIANLAAVSGSTSQQASTAMYQLSQALAAGKVQLMDWNSVVNAGMGGQVFQDALKRTASQMGYNVDEMIKKYGSFRESLTKGEWLTAEVLTETLTQLSGAYSEADLIAQGYTEEQAKEISKLAETAVNAATKVKTFTQLMDTLKESAQSGWTQTWELLIGDFEEAKALWTSVSDKLGEIINKSSERRNNLLGGALNSNWDKMVGKINEAGIETSTFEEKLKSVLTENGYAVDKMIEKHGSLEKAFTSGAVSSKWLNQAVSELSSSLVDLSGVEAGLEKGNTGDHVTKVQEALKSLNYDLGEAGVDGIFGSKTEEAIKAFQELKGLEVTGVVDEKTLKALEEATGKTKDLKGAVGGYVDEITKLGGRESIIQSFKNVWEALVRIVTPIKEAFREVFPPATSDQLYKGIEAVRSFTEKLIASDETVENIKKTFKGLFSVVSVFVNIIKSVGGGIVKIVSSLTGLGGGVAGITGAIGDWLTKMSASIKEANWFGNAIDKIVGFVTNAINKIKEFGISLKENFSAPKAAGGIFGFFISLWNTVKNIANSIIQAMGSVGSTISEAFGKGDIFEVFNSGLVSGIFLSITKFTKSLSDGFDNAGGFLENLTGILDDVRGCFQAYQDQLKAGTLMKIATAIGILAAAIFVISTINPDTLSQSLGAITILFAELLAFSAAFSKLGGGFKDFSKSIPLIMSLSIAVLILSASLKILSTIEVGALTNSVMAISILMVMLIGAAKAMEGKDTAITKFAGQMILMSIAIAALSGAAKILGSMNWNQLAVAGVGLLGITVLLVGAAKIMDGKDAVITKFAGQMVIMSAAIGIVGLVAKLLGTMNWNQLAVAGAGITGIVILLVTAAKIMDSNDKSITKFAGQMVIMSIAIAALAGVAKIFSSMSWGELAKGGVGLLGIVALLVAAAKIMDGKYASITKFAGQMVIMSLGITVMAGALKILSGLSIKQILTGLLGLAGALTIIGVAGLLLEPIIPAILALGGALALFGLGIVGIGAGLVMIGAGITSISVALAAGAISIVGGLTSIILGLLNLVPEIAQIIGRTILEVAALIGDYAPQLAESFCKLIVSTVESLATYGPQLVNSLLDLLINLINGLADHVPTLITAFANLLGKIFEGVVTALNNADTTNLLKGIAAVGLMSIVAYMLSGMLAVLPSAMIGLVAVGILIAELALVLAAVGQLTKIEGVEDGIAKAGDILNGIGKAIGRFIGGIGEGLTESLVDIGQNIADFMDKLSLASDNAKGVDGTAFDGVSQLIGVMGDIALTTVGTSISDIFTLGGTSMEKFETDGVAFFDAMKAISQASAGITLDEASIGAVIGIATQLSDLQSSLEPIGGVVDWFTGRDDLGTFGKNAGAFITSISTALTNLGTVTVNTESLTAIVDAATQLADLQTSLEPIGGVVDWFTGKDDLATFGTNIGDFISSMVTGLGSLSGVTINTEALGPIIDAATQLSDLQTNLESIGGVIDWFTGKDDLATFGENVGGFISSMVTAMSGLGETSFDAEALTAIVDAATQLSDLQTNLESIGGVVDWFTGKDDLSTFGESVSGFISSIQTAFSGLTDMTINTEAMTAIIDAATQLSGLQTSLESIGGVVDWFTGKDDLGTFGTNAASFIGSMKTAFADLGDTTINSEAMTSLVDAATQLADLQSSLTNMDGVISWFTGHSDLGTFGTKIGEFATAMGTLKTNMGEDGIPANVVTSITNAGNALVALNDTLPEKGWFDKKEDLTDFSTHITNFATAISDFSTTCSTLNADGINIAMSAANRIKNLINRLADIDTSGVEKFTGIGTGGYGADGAVSDIADALVDFGTKVSGVDVSAISTASTSATRIKNLIAGLVDLDTSGIEKFKITSIATSLKDYSTNIAGMDVTAVSTSIIAANKIKSFINSLASLDTSGVSAFTSSISNLGQADVSSFTSTFSSVDLSSIGSNLMSTLTSGISSKNSSLTNTATSMVNSMSKAITDKANTFNTAGVKLITNLIKGFSSKSAMLKTTVGTTASSASGALLSSYSKFYANGKYLGEGLVLGIKAKKQSVWDAAYALGKAAVEGEKAGQQSNSPSKATIQAGKWFGEGLVIGIDNMGTKVYKAGRAIGDTAVKSLSTAMAKTSEMVNSGMFDNQPTIRPVLDLSDVKAGASNIGNLLGMGQTIGVSTNIGTVSSMMNNRIQNGGNGDVVSAIGKLGKQLSNIGGNTYNVNGVTYDDGSNVSNAVSEIIRAIRIEGRA